MFGAFPRSTTVYAIIRSGGKQYRVEEGSIIEVERLNAGEGDKVELGEVLLLADGDSITVGRSMVQGARVLAEVIEQSRSPKVTVFKYKAKTRYRRKTGHRQPFTRLAIREILTAEKMEKAAPKRTRKAAAKETDETQGE